MKIFESFVLGYFMGPILLVAVVFAIVGFILNWIYSNLNLIIAYIACSGVILIGIFLIRLERLRKRKKAQKANQLQAVKNLD